MNPPTQNMYRAKYSFDAANTINQILPDFHNFDEYVLVSLYVISLFNKVPLKRSVEIFLKYIYTDTETALTKRSLRKLILDTASNDSFLF